MEPAILQIRYNVAFKNNLAPGLCHRPVIMLYMNSTDYRKDKAKIHRVVYACQWTTRVIVGY